VNSVVLSLARGLTGAEGQNKIGYMSESLNTPPFPQLEWNKYDYWDGQIVLPAWAGFQSRLGDYGAESSTTVSDGSARLNIVTRGNEKIAPSPEQAAAYQYLVKQQEVVRDSIFQAIFAKYSEWQEDFGYDEEEIEKYMPNIEQPDQLKSLMGLSTVRIFHTSKNGLAYVGFEFGCTWDDEHGLGAMTHGNRVVELGGADTAILQWIADKDAESN
jgi:hypothetical protein